MKKFEGMLYSPSIFRLLWKHLADKYVSEPFKYLGIDYQRYSGSGVSPVPSRKNTIVLLGIRNNTEIAFNNEFRDNDDLIIYENTSSGAVRLWRFKCTMDPKSKKKNIAHHMKGVWASYRVGNHRHQPGRTALRQDMNKVLVVRTNRFGVMKKAERDYFGINVHNKNGYFNSSLGCTILESDMDYETKFKPLLKRIENSPVTYLVTDKWDVADFLDRIIIKSLEPRPIEIKPLDTKPYTMVTI